MDWADLAGVKFSARGLNSRGRSMRRPSNHLCTANRQTRSNRGISLDQAWWITTDSLVTEPVQIEMIARGSVGRGSYAPVRVLRWMLLA